MRRLITSAARLYPRRWRERYGDEFAALLAETEASVPVLLDVLRGAAQAHLEGQADGIRMLRGGLVSTNLAATHATRFGLAGLMVALPTSLLVTLSLLKYVLGVPGPFDAVEPALTPLVTHPIGETAVILAPYVALLLAAAPVTRVQLGWHQGQLSANVRVSAPALNVLVTALSAGLIAIMIGYYLIENF